MQLTYQFDVNGYWVIQRAIYRQVESEPSTRAEIGWLVFVVACMAALAVKIGHMRLDDHARSAGFLVIAVLIGGMQLWRSYRESLNRAFSNYARAGATGQYVVEFDASGIRVSSPHGELFVRWSVVARIVREQDTLVFIGGPVFGVPLVNCSDLSGNTITSDQIISTVQSLSALPISFQVSGLK